MTGETSSTKGFGEPWLRRTVASRSVGNDGRKLIEKIVKGSVVFIQKWVEKLWRVGDYARLLKIVEEGSMVNRIEPTECVRLWWWWQIWR